MTATNRLLAAARDLRDATDAANHPGANEVERYQSKYHDFPQAWDEFAAVLAAVEDEEHVHTPIGWRDCHGCAKLLLGDCVALLADVEWVGDCEDALLCAFCGDSQEYEWTRYLTNCDRQRILAAYEAGRVEG